MRATAGAVLALACCLGAVGCAKPSSTPPPTRSAATPAPNVDLTGRTVLIVIAPKDYRDEELLVPRDALVAAGAKVTVASTATDEAVGMLGGTIRPDTTLAAAKAADYDAVVFVGGQGATVLFDDAGALQLARDATGEGKVVGAICLAPALLAKAGVLGGRQVTVWESEISAVEAAGARYTGATVTVDGKLVTGNGPEAAGEFARRLVELLAK